MTKLKTKARKRTQWSFRLLEKSLERLASVEAAMCAVV